MGGRPVFLHGSNKFVVKCFLIFVAPYSQPQNLSGASLSSTSISLHWVPPPDHLINGVLRYYHVLISDPAQAIEYDSLVDGEVLEVFVDNLHPNLLYDCSVTAVTVDDGPSSSLQILTLEDGELIPHYNS